MGIFDDDIVLDEEAFDKAISDFSLLGDKLKKLRHDIEDMVNTLKYGFDTPAGVKFMNSCENNLFKPLDDQQLVLEHISDTLQQSKQSYSTVFKEYEDLQNTINNSKQ